MITGTYQQSWYVLFSLIRIHFRKFYNQDPYSYQNDSDVQRWLIHCIRLLVKFLVIFQNSIPLRCKQGYGDVLFWRLLLRPEKSTNFILWAIFFLILRVFVFIILGRSRGSRSGSRLWLRPDKKVQGFGSATLDVNMIKKVTVDGTYIIVLLFIF